MVSFIKNIPETVLKQRDIKNKVLISLCLITLIYLIITLIKLIFFTLILLYINTFDYLQCQKNESIKEILDLKYKNLLLVLN